MTNATGAASRTVATISSKRAGIFREAATCATRWGPPLHEIVREHRAKAHDRACKHTAHHRRTTFILATRELASVFPNEAYCPLMK